MTKSMFKLSQILQSQYALAFILFKVNGRPGTEKSHATSPYPTKPPVRGEIKRLPSWFPLSITFLCMDYSRQYLNILEDTSGRYNPAHTKNEYI